MSDNNKNRLKQSESSLLESKTLSNNLSNDGKNALMEPKTSKLNEIFEISAPTIHIQDHQSPENDSNGAGSSIVKEKSSNLSTSKLPLPNAGSFNSSLTTSITSSQSVSSSSSFSTNNSNQNQISLNSITNVS